LQLYARPPWQSCGSAYCEAGTLALAVGGTGALLSLFNAVVLRQLPVREPERLVAVFPASGEALFGISGATLAALKARQTVFEELCGFSRSSGGLHVDVRGVVWKPASEAVSGGCHPMLGVHAFLGRLIDERDAPLTSDAAPVVVISHRFWTKAFGSDPTVIGQALLAQGVSLSIIGVTPPDLGGFDADQAPDLIVPLGTQAKLLGGTGQRALHSVGRLRRGVTLEAAAAELRGLWPDVWGATNPVPPGQRPSRAGAAESLRVEPIARGLSLLRERYAQPLFVLLGRAILARGR